MDLFEESPGDNAPEFTVSEISGAVKRVIEGEFGRIRVRGEVGRVFRARSGHLYYDIKDDRSVLACTTWKGQVGGLSVMPEEGLEVVVTGRLTTFAAQSKYNMNVDEMVVAGVGALMAMLEKRRKALEAEGLFDPARKKKIPFLPEVIGVVTSPSGAVIRDILHRLRDRFPRKVLIWPVAVQGDRCAPEVAAAIRGFNALEPGGAIPRPDLVIVARGGGSIEDLWGFNEEAVVRAAAESRVPLISAVGHETDTTLIDFAADQRAPTPTAAAELAVPVRAELLAWVQDQDARLARAVTRALARRGEKLRDLVRVLPRRDALFAEARQRFDRIEAALPVSLIRLAERKGAQLAKSAGAIRPALLQTRLREANRRLAAVGMRLDPALRRALAADRDKRRRDAEGLSALSMRLAAAFEGYLRQRKERIDAMDRLRIGLGYRETLKRGYAVVRAGDAVVTHAPEAAAARSLEIEFDDGRVPVVPRQRGGSKRADPSGQGSLF